MFSSSIETDRNLLICFAEVLRKLDQNFDEPIGIQWLGREVVLVGIFAAIGNYAKKEGKSKLSALEEFSERLDDFVASANLVEFEDCRNRLELSKVNIGNKNKRAVFLATFDFLASDTKSAFDWPSYFEGETNEA